MLLADTYPTAERLAQSLKEGEVDYILVDMYLPVKRKDLFNGSWFEIEALLKTEVFHGIILQGDALKLASTLEEMIANNNVQTKFLADSDTEVKPFLLFLTERILLPPTRALTMLPSITWVQQTQARIYIRVSIAFGNRSDFSVSQSGLARILSLNLQLFGEFFCLYCLSFSIESK